MQTAPRLPCMRPQRVGQYSRRISERCFTHPRSDCDEDRVRNPWVCGARGAHQPELLVAGDSAFANPPRRNPFRPQFFPDAILSRRRKKAILPKLNPSRSQPLRNAVPPKLAFSPERNPSVPLQVDMWSFGVIVYILLCGFPPFYGDNDHELFRKIKAGHFRFRSPYWDHVSRDAKDFISRLLTVDWKRRMTADQALTHTWLAAEVGTQPNAEGDAQLPPVGSMVCSASKRLFHSLHKPVTIVRSTVPACPPPPNPSLAT